MKHDDDVVMKYDRSYPREDQLDDDIKGRKNSSGRGTSATATVSTEKKRFPSDSEVEENKGEDEESE